MGENIKMPLGDNVAINDNTDGNSDNSDNSNTNVNNNVNDNNNDNNDNNSNAENNQNNQNNNNVNPNDNDNNNDNNNQNNDNNQNNQNNDNNSDNNQNPDDNIEDVIEVDINGDIYKLDENGNAITETGEVKFTAEQLKEFEEISNNDNFDLIDLTQIQPVDDKGNPIVYENTPDGRRKYVEDVYKAGAIEKANQIIEERYRNNPLLKTVTDYIIAKGSLEGFSQQDFVRQPISDKSTEDELIATIRTARKMKGDSEVEINNVVSWAKTDGKLKELAETSDAYLTQHEQARREAISKQAQEAERKRLEQTQRYVADLTNTITNGKIKVGDSELIIPANLKVKTDTGDKVVPREELVKYATEINQYRMPNGKVVNATQYQIDKYVKNQRRSVNDDIYEMISLFTGQDNSQILKAAVNNHRANTIRKKLKFKTNVDTNNNNQHTKPKLKLKYSK